MTVRAAVVGVGYLGRHHARIYAELEGVELIGVVDSNRKQADDIAAQYGCAAFSDHREILDKVDALSIVTPTTAHYAVARDCIAAGKDLLIEKPITTTIEEADCLIQQAAKKGVLIQVGHLERFNPVLEALTPLIQNPVFLEAERISPFQGRGTDVDITLDLMIHDIDIVLGIMQGNPVTSVKASGMRLMTKTIDVAKAWLDFENGTHALLTASRVAPDKSRKLTVYQKDCHLIMDYQAMEIKKYYVQGGAIAYDVISVERTEPLKEELRHFIACIRTRSTPRVCGLKGRDALTIALQAGFEIKKRWQQA
jgi:predicted dehydrogenase